MRPRTIGARPYEGGIHRVSHGHGHSHAPSSERRIGTAFFLNLGFTVLEIVGGLMTNSVAVLSDALHDLGDSIALGLTWHLTRLSKRQGDEVFTFGYRRFSLLGALVMSVVLFGGGILVLFEAIPRLIAPQPTDARGMLILAGVGILVNGVAALRMHGGRSLGERVVTWHFIEDVLGWVAVLVAGIVMMVRDVPILDPVLSLLITLYVLWNIGRRLKETFVILLQGVPDGIDVATIEDAMRAMDGVCDVHHTHVWSQDGEHHVLTAHVVSDVADSFAAVSDLRARLKKTLARFGIQHATIEVESVNGPACTEDRADCHIPHPGEGDPG
jgi:cobalt-zinc-cadmium efflux system protein